MPSPSRRHPDRPAWLQLSGIGFELAAAVAGLTLLGYWIDQRYGTGPWGVLVGLILGIVGGLYNAVRQALRASRPRERGTDEARSRPPGPGAR